MYLTFINPLNKNHKGEYIYEFIFSKLTEIELGEDWDINPASSGHPGLPSPEFISEVGLIKTKNIELDLVINSDIHSLLECVENIVALGWEKEPPDHENRLVFQFGETMESIKNKFYSRDIVMIDLKNEKNEHLERKIY